MAKTQPSATGRRSPDLLAAVVLHTLLAEGRGGLTSAHIAIACRRDPNKAADAGEIETALKILLDDGLAERTDALYRPTRVAIRADELSF